MAQQSVTVTLSNGDTHHVTIDNPDRIRFDLTRAKHGWPPFTEAVFLGLTFMAWNSMKRNGLYSDTFEQFSEYDAIGVDPHDDDDEVEPLPPVQGSATH